MDSIVVQFINYSPTDVILQFSKLYGIKHSITEEHHSGSSSIDLYSYDSYGQWRRFVAQRFIDGLKSMQLF